MDPVQPRAVRSDRVADDLFLVLLDDGNGQMRAHSDVIGSVLAGALLVELAVGGWIEVDAESVEPTTEARQQDMVPGDALAHLMLDTVLGQLEPLSPRDWIAFLADSAEQEVADRLARWNLISVQQRRRVLGGKGVSYKPANNNVAAWPRARLSEHCRRGRELGSHDLALTGLCHASGLLRNVLDGAPAGMYDRAMREVHTRLGPYPSVIALFAAVEGAVTADASALA
ncbi:GPP34 family phosphoprotein [Actinoplanes sp. NPDC026619]|uniref:GOLPH3/VPS74 family protein n=1 Tax=Actinoplanes sp. NPDC026619 TaxID=3155798 RepID=UPI0033EF8FD9